MRGYFAGLAVGAVIAVAIVYAAHLGNTASLLVGVVFGFGGSAVGMMLDV